MTAQMRLFDRQAPDYSRHALVLSQANETAWKTVREHARWPAGALALWGPPGSGKTHMGVAFAEEAGAQYLQAQAPSAGERANGRLFVIDDGDRAGDDAGLAQILDWALGGHGKVLLIAAAPPKEWPARLIDLKSRLSALACVSLREPDDEVLQAVLQRQCRARFLNLTPEAARYLAQCMERSYQAAAALADLLALHCRAPARPISAKVAGQILRHAKLDWPEPDTEPDTGDDGAKSEPA